MSKIESNSSKSNDILILLNSPSYQISKGLEIFYYIKEFIYDMYNFPRLFYVYIAICVFIYLEGACEIYAYNMMPYTIFY